MVKEKQEINSSELALAFQKAAETAYQAVEEPVEGTILTVIRESAATSLDSVKKGKDIADITAVLQEMLYNAEQTLARTPDMLPVLKEAGVVDAGAQGFVFMLEAMLDNLRGEKPRLSEISIQKSFNTIKIKENLEDKYCVECVIEGNNLDLSKVRDELDKYGSSLIIGESQRLIKIHLHTNYPKKLIQYCSSIGKLSHSNVKDMEKQQQNFLSSKENKNELKRIGIVATIVGEGLADIFKNMGADVTIVGKKTINPSLRNLAEAIKKMKSENAIILPNDSNVLPVARQATKMFDNIHIIPSRTIPQGISALLAFNEEFDLNTNKKNMNRALKKVKSGIITYAINKGRYGKIRFKKDDILGFNEKELRVVGENIYKVTTDLINSMANRGCQLISLFYGKKIKSKEVKKLVKMVKFQHPNLEVQFYYGGQPNYHYIISAE
jgi:hypothetical protein